MKLEIEVNEYKILHDTLCEGLYYFGGYGFDLDYNPKEYARSKAVLSKSEHREIMCLEDVQVQMIKDGYDLIFTDNEGDEDSGVYFLNKDTLQEGLKKVPLDLLVTAINEKGDADTYDSILQYILFGEITYS